MMSGCSWCKRHRVACPGLNIGNMWVAILIMMPQRLISIIRMKCAFRLTRRLCTASHSVSTKAQCGMPAQITSSQQSTESDRTHLVVSRYLTNWLQPAAVHTNIFSKAWKQMQVFAWVTLDRRNLVAINGQVTLKCELWPALN